MSDSAVEDEGGLSVGPDDFAGLPPPRKNRLWRRVLACLEIIGLRRASAVDSDAVITRLRHHHAEFRQLLTSNDSFLNSLASLNDRLRQGDVEDLLVLERLVLKASVDVFRMIRSLDVISDGYYPGLTTRYERIGSELAAVFEQEKATQQKDLVLDLDQIDRRRLRQVGGKMANLGEIRSKLKLPVPDGFAVTVEAYRQSAEQCGILSALRSWHKSDADEDRELETIVIHREQLLASPLPENIVSALLAAYDRLGERCGASPQVAVRSSATGEDGSLSHAGQYLTELGVTRDKLTAAYRNVLASLFSPEAVQYRQVHGIPHELTSMAVGVLVMVDARASGVVFTEDPSRPGSEELLIYTVPGLGDNLVSDRTAPEIITIDRASQPVLKHRRTRRIQKGLHPTASVFDDALQADAERKSISDGEALLLADWSLQLERHFGGPQDIEWAIDRNGSLMILQSRPMRYAARTAQAGPPEAGAIVLAEHGETACPGVGIGPAVLMDETSDLDDFPQGGVLVTPRPSPKFVRVMRKAAAIVSATGSTVGHMASLARELGVPTLLDLHEAVNRMTPGQVITVDADRGYVYEGEVTSLRKAMGQRSSPARSAREESTRRGTGLEEKIGALVAHLTLTDPRSPVFKAEHCASLHDLARFIHEKCYEEMFRKGEGLGGMKEACFYLDVFLPIDLYIIDLGGGIKSSHKSRTVTPGDIVSCPLRALLQGMLDPRLPRFGPRPMDMRGFFSIMARHAINNPEQERTFREPSYVMASDRYMNFTARVGYHFSVVDTYCGATPTKNYINLLFRGGAADIYRRGRRVQAMAGIFREIGFDVEVRGDSVTARLAKISREEIAAKLEAVGRLFQFARQMDITMVSDEAVKRFEQAFLSGDYSLAGLVEPSQPSDQEN